METTADDAEDDRLLDRRVSKAVEEEQAFLEYIASLPAMSSENVEAFNRKEQPVDAQQETVGGLETLDNLYKLMEHLGRLRRQNSKLQKRLHYLENTEPDCDEVSRSRRYSSKTKTLTRTVSKDDANVTTTVKSKVSKWTKVKEAFRWEKASGGVLLPEAASQDSGLGGGDFHLRPPGDRSSHSVSPAESVLSGPPPPSLSTSEDELELDLSDCGQKRRRLSVEKNVHLGVEDDETRRSKSLDGESIESTSGTTDHHQSHTKETRSSHMSQKVHKTPWSKVKDIIQTRTGSIKKKKGAEADADEEGPVDTLEGDDREYEFNNFEFVLSEEAADANSEATLQRMANTCNRNKRLAPVLTITLPSTEELRPPDTKAGVSPTPSIKNGKPPPSPQVEDKHNRTLMRQKTLDEMPSKEHYKKQVSSSSAGTSPPTPRRKSKWSKVKNAFLTSTPSPEEITAHFSNSTPSSPINKCTSFLYDLESDELSSSEFIDENLQENNDNVFIEPADDRVQQTTAQKNLADLHLRFSNEFHQKLSEWERIRNSGIGISSPPSAGKVSASGLSSGTSSVGEEDKRDRRRADEWDKAKSCRKRESLALQQLGEENLSPDFKKKLEQWERIKAVPVSPTQESTPQLQSKKKITDWQRWRPGSSSTKNDTHNELPEEFSKRLQDWDRMKHGTSVDCDPTQKPANRTPSPGVSHDLVFEHKSRKIQHRLSETKEKWADTGHKVLKSKSHHEVKELAWLEKELHKIEREKQRLERERDKYLEREARLQKMRRAIGSTQQKQEVVIPTSTGVFRFEGISQKFTKKLYEWEKARGIGPEASTIALLDPGYKPQSGESISGETIKKNGALLLRSKSMGSVVDIAGGGGCQTSVITHQPSSLSLNNMEEIGNTQIIGQDPDSCLSDKEEDYGMDEYEDGDEPGAVIVDIEDVVEETASPLAEPPAVHTEIPVYCYAPAEVTRLIDSSGSENELSNENVQSSYCILQENIDLLDELKKKEDICRRIEIRMENIEEKMQSTANYREKKLESLSMDEQNMDKVQCDPGQAEVAEMHDIKSQLKILDDDQEALKQEEETLQYSFVEHSEQQAMLAQSLVDNMRQLQEVNNCMSSKQEPPDSPKRSSDDRQEEALSKVQDLTGQLLTMAERLEEIVGERNKEISRLRETVSLNSARRPYLSKHSLSTDSITMPPTSSSSIGRLPRQSSEELSQLPTMLTSKVLELKRGLTYLCAVSDAAVRAVSRTCNVNDDKPTNLDPTGDITTVSELCQGNHETGNALNKKPDDKDERESGLKSNYEDHLIVGCLTLPALRLRKDGNKHEFAIENESKKLVSGAITESTPLEIAHDSAGSNPECGSPKNQMKSIDMGSGNTDDSEQKSKKGVKMKIERQSSKDSIRRTRFAECTKGESEPAVGYNIRSRRLKRETSNESRLKYEEERRRESSSKGGSQSEGRLGEETLKLHITESEGNDRSTSKLEETSNKKDLEVASSVTESVAHCSTIDMNKSCQVSATAANSEPVDVFVPTTRKIFSPVRRDSKGKASSVISYIVRENAPPEQVPLSPRRVRRRNEQEDKTKIQNKKLDEEEEENKRESINFVMPPCWILRETRAQSASPALQRRHFPVPRSREKQTELDIIPKTRKNVELKIEEGEQTSSQTPVPDESLAHKSNNLQVGNSEVQGNKFGNYGTLTSPTPPTPPLAKKYSVPNRENPSSDSMDKNSSEVKPLRKSRTEIGFPPISPIPGRREVKLSKETAPSIRMIIARYNQKVSESQEMLGSKSPDSGSGSPLPWRSPGAERRVRVQMEKYQDEVRRALQGSEGRKHHHFSGEVKKSASASFIRTFDRGSTQDRFGRRPSDSLSERQTSEMRYNGILKSSSAGSIKPATPVPQRREATTPQTLILETTTTTTHIPPSTPPVQTPPSENPVIDTDMQTVTSVLENQDVEEKVGRESRVVCSAEPSGSRALRIKKAKEEFLSRGPGGVSTNAEVRCEAVTPSTSECVTLSEGATSWSKEKSRLSRVSCESEASCDEGILVSGEEHRQPFDSRLLVKSASAGMINIDSQSFGSTLPESTSNSSVPSEQGASATTSTKPRFAFSNIASRFRKVKMRRHKEKERDKMETVSTLCRQSLVVDIEKRKATDKVSSKSCPSSPVLHKRESNSSWSISPRRIFKPK